MFYGVSIVPYACMVISNRYVKKSMYHKHAVHAHSMRTTDKEAGLRCQNLREDGYAAW